MNVPAPYSNRDKTFDFNPDLEGSIAITNITTKLLETMFDSVKFVTDENMQRSGYGDYLVDGKRLEAKCHEYDKYLMAKDFERRNGYRTLAFEVYHDMDNKRRGNNIMTFSGTFWLDAFLNQDRTAIIEYFLLDSQLVKSWIQANEDNPKYYKSPAKNKGYISQTIHVPLKEIKLFVYQTG
jgi:hypothetical protein